jgi:maleate isomerase
MALRIGLIVPPTNTVNEVEWRRMAPRGMGFPLVRMPLHSGDDTHALYADLKIALEELRSAKPDVVAYACTTGSLVLPLETLPAYIRKEAGVPGVATAPALVHACRALGLRKVAVATPYHDALNEHERRFLEACGIQVKSLRGLGIGAGGPHEYVEIARVPKQQVYEHCRDTDVPEADGMIISCTDFAAQEAVPRLEAELGKPVVSSNLATFWAALRAAGISTPLPGFGSLLTSFPEDRASR